MAYGATVNFSGIPSIQIPIAFRVFQTRISFTVLDMLLLTLVLTGSVASIANREQVQQSTIEVVGVGLLVSAAGIGLVVLHGLVRLLAYRWCGVPLYSVSIDYSGDEPDVSRAHSTPLIEVCIGLVGIAASLIHAAALLALYTYWATDYSNSLFKAATLTLTLFMLALAFLQFIPGISQDGGQIARGLIWFRTGSPLRGAWLTGRIGQATGAILTVGLGLVFVFSFELVLGAAIVILGLHLGMMARSGAHRVGWQYVKVREEIELRDLLEDPAHLIPADDTVAERFRMLMQDRSAAYLVIDPQGVACGVVGARNLNPIVLLTKRGMNIAAVMTPLEHVRSLPSEWSASAAWRSLRQAGESAIVITARGVPYDIITHDQLRRRLVVQTHRGYS